MRITHVLYYNTIFPIMQSFILLHQIFNNLYSQNKNRYNIDILQKGGEYVIDYMPNTDLQYKDDLRKQRDDWQDILEYINNNELDKAKRKAEKILYRINETLPD